MNIWVPVWTTWITPLWIFMPSLCVDIHFQFLSFLVNIFLTIQGTAILFSKVAVPFCIFTSNVYKCQILHVMDWMSVVPFHSQFIYSSSNPQCNASWRRGLWEIIRFRWDDDSGAPMLGWVPSWEETPWSLVSFLGNTEKRPYEDTARRQLTFCLLILLSAVWYENLSYH